MDTVSEALLTTDIPSIAERRFLRLWNSITWTRAGGAALVGTFTGPLVPPRLRAATAGKLTPVTAVDLGEWGRCAMVMRVARVYGPLDRSLWAVGSGEFRLDAPPFGDRHDHVAAVDIGVDSGGSLTLRPLGA
ncbi:hypothetical protein [Nocardia otitidiscaviarum]|uniref:hypothetical protein n=1 Tax=Nocardia otitidiscaviarum TaxID=1823 RepID=UPI001895AFEE|nr:hypothetical protein [Nocardia otitidiscaviarum]MBF6240332.1 hypothetical protein [Nocardia otitidiscaviarum]